MKKKSLINIAITVSIIIIVILSFNGKVYAENETENTNTAVNTETTTTNTTKENITPATTTTNTNEEKNNSVAPETTQKTTSNQNGTTSNNKTTTNTSKKSSNANLSNLGITPNDFKGFKAQVTKYDVTVPTDLESVTIYANAQDSKAKVSGVGKQNLQTGENKFDVVVTAEDGTTKTYTLNITRDTSSKNTENVPERYSGDGLASLSIENLELSPAFDTQKYEYSVKYFGEKESLDINATATDPYYIVEITGNEKLIEGENIINILVSDPDGNNVATYQITVNKALVDEEAVAKEKKERIIVIVSCIIAGIVIIVIIIIIIKKIRNKKNKYFDKNQEDEYNQLEDYDENMNYIKDVSEYNEEEVPKAFREDYNKNDDNSNFNNDEKDKSRKNHKGKRFK